MKHIILLFLFFLLSIQVHCALFKKRTNHHEKLKKLSQEFPMNNTNPQKLYQTIKQLEKRKNELIICHGDWQPIQIILAQAQKNLINLNVAQVKSLKCSQNAQCLLPKKEPIQKKDEESFCIIELNDSQITQLFQKKDQASFWY